MNARWYKHTTYEAELSSLCSRYETELDQAHWIQRDRASTATMEGAESEMNILSNGKGHDHGEDMCVPVKMISEEDQWVLSLLNGALLWFSPFGIILSAF